MYFSVLEEPSDGQNCRESGSVCFGWCVAPLPPCSGSWCRIPNELFIVGLKIPGDCGEERRCGPGCAVVWGTISVSHRGLCLTSALWLLQGAWMWEGVVRPFNSSTLNPGCDTRCMERR